MALQVERYRPRAVVMATDAACETLRAQLPTGAAAHLDLCGAGPQALIDLVTRDDVDTVLCASSGTAALEAVVAAIRAGKRIALANKEVLVMAGRLVMDLARAHGVDVLPVDSEHNAIHQCLHRRDPLGSAPADPDRVGRAVPAPVRRGAGRRHRRRRAQPSDLADGPQDHHRLGDADEQGPRGDRGALAVRDAAGGDRRRRPSAIGRPFAGRADRRIDHRPARRDRHAAAHPVRLLVAGPLGRGAARP